MCFGNQHTFIWGSGTTGDPMPLSLRCCCGLLRRGDMPVTVTLAEMAELQAENARLAEQLRIATDALRASQAEARRLREAAEGARQYLSGAIESGGTVCACWGASGCDAHELIHDLDQALAATTPAPAREEM